MSFSPEGINFHVIKFMLSLVNTGKMSVPFGIYLFVYDDSVIKNYIM